MRNVMKDDTGGHFYIGCTDPFWAKLPEDGVTQDTQHNFIFTSITSKIKDETK